MKNRHSTAAALTLAVSGLFILIAGCTSFDTYARVGGDHLRLNNGEKELFWFSGIHCNDPDHRMFDDIEKEFTAFMPDLVLVEGGSNRPSPDRKTAILKGGEPLFVAFLGFSMDIAVMDIEPPPEAQYRYLLGRYDDRDVLAMYVIRQMHQKQREVKDSKEIKIDFFDYFIGFLLQMKDEGFPIEETIDAAFITALLRPYLGTDVTQENWTKIETFGLLNHTTPPGIIRTIRFDTLSFRDDYAVELVWGLSKNYSRIFIMMGGDHIKTQRERLEKIYGRI